MKHRIVAFILFSLAPAFASAATMNLSPSVKSVTVGDIVTLRAYVNAQGTAINNAEGVISFPTDILQAISVSKSDSIFSLWLEEPTFSNSAGTVSFNGGVPNPGFSSSNGTELTMTFRVKQAGTATLSIGDAAVRANDGLGTDVLTNASGAVITATSPVIPEAPAPIPPPTQAPSNGSSVTPIISSVTNPNQNGWYSVPKPQLSWSLSEGVTAVQMGVSAHADATPVVTYQPAVSNKTLDTLPDGTWYFRARFKTAAGWGPTATYALHVDTKVPIITTHEFTYDETRHALAVSADATDERSGIVGYTLQIDDQTPVSVTVNEVTSGRYFSEVRTSGLHIATLVARDAAGNEARVSGTFSVPESLQNQALFSIGGVPVTLITVIIFLLVFVVLTLAVALVGWYRLFLYRNRFRGSIDKTAADMHRGLLVLKSDIEKHVRAIEKAKTKRDLTEEEEAFTVQMKENMADFEKYIDADLSKVAPVRRRRSPKSDS